MRLALISDGADHTARLLGEAAAAGGNDVVAVDLRHDRFSLRTGPARTEVAVLLNGTRFAPDLVVNLSGANPSGLCSPAALVRQRAETWYERHIAAREEQGLLVAVLDRLALDGVEVINTAAAADMTVMSNLVVEALAARSVAVVPGADPVERYVVVRGRVVLRPGQVVPRDQALRLCRWVAEAARFDLGEVDLTETGSVGAWRPGLSLGLMQDGHARAVAAGVVEALTGERPPALSEAVPYLFVPDLVENLIDPPTMG